MRLILIMAPGMTRYIKPIADGRWRTFVLYIGYIGHISIGYTGIAANIGHWTLDTGYWTYWT